MNNKAIVAAITFLTASYTYAGIQLTVDQPLLVAGTKNNAKILEELIEDRDYNGIVQNEDQNNFGEIPAGAVFYIEHLDMWGDVDTIRYNGEIDYVPHAELNRVTHGKLEQILKNSVDGMSRPDSVPAATPENTPPPKAQPVATALTLKQRENNAVKSLNEVWSQIKASVPYNDFIKVRDDERAWIKATKNLNELDDLVATERRVTYLQGILQRYPKR
jgi:hypothetical protein